MTHTGGPEHDFEPVPGLPGRLPDGERIIWQGTPRASAVSRRVLKTRWIAGYFALLALWNVASGISDERDALMIVFSAGVVLLMGGLVVAMLEAFAWGVQKTTLYTITNRRIVMRIGVALSATFNLPFAQIHSADMRADAHGNGDIALTMKPGHRLSLLVFWPHVRGWHKGNMIPQLIGLDNAAEVAGLLSREFRAFAGNAAVVATTSGQASGPGYSVPEAIVAAE